MQSTSKNCLMYIDKTTTTTNDNLAAVRLINQTSSSFNFDLQF